VRSSSLWVVLFVSAKLARRMYATIGNTCPVSGVTVHRRYHRARYWQPGEVRLARRIANKATRATEGKTVKALEEYDGVILEKQGNRIRRYTKDVSSPSGIRVSEERLSSSGSGMLHSTQLLEDASTAVQTFLLPAGYPNSVTPDYLPFMMWTFPTHVTGWLYSSLTTASLLEGVGVNTSGKATGVVAATAAIKWLTKDGLGSLGRLIVGGRFSDLVDTDPKRWRLVAEAFAVTGSLFELSTILMPSQFLALASAGTLTKAVGKGFAKPSFRVIQNHFAISNNIGSVAAKEEVWEVFAQLLGLGLSVLLLKRTGVTSSYTSLFGSWLAMVIAHVVFRYISLSKVIFKELNLKRAKVLMTKHVFGEGIWAVSDVNSVEQIAVSGNELQPRMSTGCTLEEVIVGNLKGKAPVSEVTGGNGVMEMLAMYTDEHYLLGWCEPERRAYVALKEGADSETVLRAMWQAAWLDRYHTSPPNVSTSGVGLLRESYAALCTEWGAVGFHRMKWAVESEGWDVSGSYLVPPGISRVASTIVS